MPITATAMCCGRLARRAGGRGRLPARAQRRRQDDDHSRHHGLSASRAPAASSMPGARSARCQPMRSRASASAIVPQERGIFPSLTVIENLTVFARGGGERTLDAAARVRAVSRPQARAGNLGLPAFRRRAADAVDRARVDAESRRFWCSTSRPKASPRSSCSRSSRR